ncbi:O-acetyl-ADP-ribose deacetylase [Candidatus Poribacteria bacterium]|nr:MAG: O-acetyl-ADP-ribose deacetylase [Candidatus Poribacteria bacterium]
MQTRLELIHGDIMDAEVDAIVNPTDLVLSGGGGLDFVIRQAAGSEVDRECEEILENRGGCQTGEAVPTSAGNLSAKYIIHTVGPIWIGGGIGEPKLLESCHRECLQLAVEKGIQSIAFPAISTGTFRYPLEKAAPVALKTVKEFVEYAQQRGDRAPELIQFFLFQEKAYVCYVKALSDLGFRLSCLLGEDT